MRSASGILFVIIGIPMLKARCYMFAKLVSLVAGYAWVPVILGTCLLYSGLSTPQLRFFAIVFFVLDCLVPFVYLHHSLRVGTIKNIDVSKREDRYSILTLMYAMYSVSLILTALYGTPMLFKLFASFYIVYSTFYLITFFWKISQHMMLNTVGITLINLVTGWSHLYLFALIPLVWWSRFSLKMHTKGQLEVGVLLAGVILLGAFQHFGLI